MLRQGVSPYEYMDDWEIFNQTSLPEKEDFYSHLNMEDVTDADYDHAKEVCRDFEIKNLGEHHDLYVQSDALLLADVFENFRNICLEIYELDPAKFLSPPGLAWQAALSDILTVFLTDIDMLLMLRKCIREGICHSIYRYAKANNKYKKDYNKNKESLYIQYWDVNNLYGWAMSQKPPVNNFEWIKDTSQFIEVFIKNYTEESDEGYLSWYSISWTFFQYLEHLYKHYNDLRFLPERKKIEQVEKLIANLNHKTEYVIHIRNLKQAINHKFLFKKVHKVIKFNQNAWLKSYIDMNTDLRKKKRSKKWLWKRFFKLMNNSVFRKTMENVRKHRDIKPFTTERGRIYQNQIIIL